ncbi:hypothetical protein HYPSUDRAFT_198503 [Hypholoma sublateritium FD-334 SS-4]|uniref:Telomere length regulation protein conserved domain-containing protein n=1 Tax=Hypholoma sublateritium (strain FD-334 SS-4) TaxID=945553 RepID=A0A0D2P8D1_HYPSF|nr:hypothetical protein HYPSUDRAFT_198503 [Hypholoma sublateritium FD-334 SS-4]
MQNVLSQLQQPIERESDLVSLLAAPLAGLGLLPPQFHANVEPLPSAEKHIGHMQRLLLTHVVPVWAPELGIAHPLLTQFFVPDLFANARPAAAAVARSAYATLLATPPAAFALACLVRLAAEYPVDRLFRAVFADGHGPVADAHWADAVRDLCAVPDRVANALALAATPPALQNAPYFAALSTRVEALMCALADGPAPAAAHAPLAYLLAKLVNVGLFPPRPPTARAQPSFFAAALPAIRAHHSPAHAALWAGVLRALPSALALQAVLASLFGALPAIEHALDPSAAVRTRVHRDAALLEGIVGRLRPAGDDQPCWDIATSLVLSREWPPAHARVFVCWLSADTEALDALLAAILAVWAAPAHIKHSLLATHRYTTALLLLALAQYPKNAPAVAALVANGAFISGISGYLAHLDPAVRRCGMLAAEAVAHRAGRALDFKDWDGDDEGRAWCRSLRALAEARDADAPLDEDPPDSDDESDIAPSTAAPARAAFAADPGADSDDSLSGYASPSSSRSASPTPSDLAEIEADPTLAVGRARVARPVYLAQLGALLRGAAPISAPHTSSGAGAAGTVGAPHEADRVAVGLASAADLIRRKRTYGTELAENAVDLACALLGMNDNFELDGFAAQRQDALTALVACAPEKAAPTLIQEFFKNQYSVEQRFAALTALALGARELAALPPPDPAPAPFASRTLPAPLHRKYAAAEDTVARLADSVTRLALTDERTEAAAAPPAARARRLRLAPQRTSITELPPSSLNPYAPAPTTITPPTHSSAPTFAAVAAEHFVMPLVHAFWGSLHAAHAREARTANRAGRARFHGAGTGLVLSPLVLSQLLGTLAVLVHAGRAAPAWLAVIAPAALELALAVGTRRVSHDEDEDSSPSPNPSDPTSGGKDASVLAAALELALAVLDGSLALDGGRALALEHTALALATREWAAGVLGALDSGVRAPGGGGAPAARLGRAAAGVLLKGGAVEEVWGRSMLGGAV